MDKTEVLMETFIFKIKKWFAGGTILNINGSI